MLNEDGYGGSRGLDTKAFWVWDTNVSVDGNETNEYRK